MIAYAYSTHLCARMKLYVMMVMLLIGVAGYIVVEILHKRKVSVFGGIYLVLSFYLSSRLTTISPTIRLTLNYYLAAW